MGERFVEAVIAAYNNESLIDPTINRILIESFRSKDTLEKDSLNLLNKFSVKEITILKLTASGMKNDDIANMMYVSEGTVRSYMHSLYTKLEVKDRLNAVRKGIQLGILTFTDMKIEQEITEETHKKVKTNRNSKEIKLIPPQPRSGMRAGMGNGAWGMGKNANAQCDRAPSRRATVHPTPATEWAFPSAFCKTKASNEGYKGWAAEEVTQPQLYSRLHTYSVGGKF
ncbi:response regulator transcription factor [Tolypothrix sp. VBCCA 56010]|uniref:response regulator transcription factor n=1 Tax=Tolypothrix sp. VBCCA 56010 TaxID=3137731 RepID=UPI003D7DA083